MLFLHRWLVPFPFLSFAFVSRCWMSTMSVFCSYDHLFTIHILLGTLTYKLLVVLLKIVVIRKSMLLTMIGYYLVCFFWLLSRSIKTSVRMASFDRALLGIICLVHLQGICSITIPLILATRWVHGTLNIVY